MFHSRFASHKPFKFKPLPFLRNITVLAIVTTLLTVPAYRIVNPGVTLLMIRNKLTSNHFPIKHTWVDIDKISPEMVLAVCAAEDNRFMQHHGFDWNAIQQAIEYNKRGKRIRGASTISQQTAKNLFLWPKRSWFRKGLEAYFTVLIELFMDKKRIMELYLNIAEFGPGIYGVEEASQRYFGKPSAKLSRWEAALLSTVLPSPLKRNPRKPSRFMLRYQKIILRNMKNLGRIDLYNSHVSKPSNR